LQNDLQSIALIVLFSLAPAYALNDMMLAQLFVNFVGIYLVIGLAFAIFFVIWGAAKIDPAATESTVGFRLIIIPGAALLWPVLAKRWWQGANPPPQHRSDKL